MKTELKLIWMWLLALGCVGVGCSGNDNDSDPPSNDDDNITDDDDGAFIEEAIIAHRSISELSVHLHLSPLRIQLVHKGVTLLASAEGSIAPIQIGFWKEGVNETGSQWSNPLVTPEGMEWFDATDGRWWPCDEDPSCEVEGKATFTINRPGGAWYGTLVIDDRPDAGFALTVQSAEFTQPDLIRFNFERGPTEGIWGGGEIHSDANLVGSAHPMFFELDPVGSESSLNEHHVPVPLFSSNKGYGVFVGQRVASALDATQPDLTSITVSSHQAELLLMAETERWEIYRRYIELTGNPLIPPQWAFAPIQWRNEHHHEQEVLDDIASIRDLDIPGSLTWVDNPWETGYNNFEFLPDRFPNMQDVINQVNDAGFGFMLWSTPYINVETEIMADAYAEGKANGYFVKDFKGDPIQYPTGVSGNDGGLAMIDWTHPEGVAWFKENFIKKVVRMGCEGFKLDYGEEVVPSLAGLIIEMNFQDGSNQSTMFQRSSDLYAKTYKEAIEEEGFEPFLLTRAGGWGGQQYTTAIWPGDLDNDFSFHELKEDGKMNVGGLPAAINNAVSLSMSGYPFYGSDIGGYRGGPSTKEVLIRWAQFQSVIPIMQLGGGGAHHNVWDFDLYDQETLDIYRNYAKLHMQLYPYFKALAAGSHLAPIVRPLGLQFPSDPEAANASYQFMVGDDLMAAPIYQEGTSRRIYIPEGEWAYWFNPEEILTGPQWVTREIPLEDLALFVRKGASIPVLPEEVDTLRPTTNPDTVFWDPTRTDFLSREF